MTAHCDLEAPALPGTSATAAAAGLREWLGLGLLALPTVLLGLDLTLLHLALPALAADLQPTSTQALWIMDAYGFMIAGFLITMGTLGDRIGRRKLLLIGAVAFGLASVLAAFSTTATMLIVARALLGIAGATLMPSTLALISNMFAVPQQRALAIGVWATMFALGMAAGPLVGGLILERFSWGAAFLVALPIVAILVAGAPILLPEYRAPQSGRIDLLSVAFSLAAMLPAIYGIKLLSKAGVALEPVAALMVGLGFAMLFVRRQTRLSSPLLDMRLFANRAFSVALIILLVGLVGVGGIMLLVTQYLQLVAGLSPLAAGRLMGPPALAVVIAGVTAPLIARLIRPAYVVAGALALSVVGYLSLARLDADPSGVGLVVAGFSLVYLGLGTIAALGTDLVVGTAPVDKAGSASAMSETVQDLGVALGIAVIGSLNTAVYRSHILEAIPENLSDQAQRALEESLWAANAVANQLPDGLLVEAQVAFTRGFNVAAGMSAGSIAILAVAAAIALRHVGTVGALPTEGMEGNRSGTVGSTPPGGRTN
jgi:MFS transporter, DHA2 family, multidrug resistance protein